MVKAQYLENNINNLLLMLYLSDRSDLMNYLISSYNLKSYLEIGLDDGYNYRRIDCKNKESVDPYFPEDHNKYDLYLKDDLPPEINSFLTYRMTSDEFFKINTKNYDLIFIDGLHTEEQVGKDIINSLKILNSPGFIVVHDCLPRSYEAQLIPRIQGEWNGSVWKCIVELSKTLDIKIWEGDYGCGIIKKPESIKNLEYPKPSTLEWNEFILERPKYVKVIDTNTIENEIRLGIF